MLVGRPADDLIALTTTISEAIFEAKDTKGRYVRFYSNGNTSDEMNHDVEAEVWGKALRLASTS